MPYHILNTTGNVNTATSTSFTIENVTGGLTTADQNKVDNLPTNTITSLALKVDKVSGKGLSTNDYDATDKAKVDNVPANTNTSLAAKVDKVTGKGLSTNDFDNTYKGQLDNAPSNINTSLAAKADLVGGKLDINQVPDSIVGAVVYQGKWNATTNSPSLADGVGTNGHYYKVGTAGSQDLGSGSIAFSIGDWVIYNGATWDQIDQSEIITSVNGQTGDVTITVPTDLSDLSEDTTHRVVTDAEKTTWNAKADTGDIPTTLAELTEDTTHRIVTDTEKGTWNAKAETSAIPTLLSDLTQSSTYRTVTDAEKTTWNNKADSGDFADAISITGTHVETTTAIDFSSIQGKALTLTANRTFTVSTGLSSSNPRGELEITHNGFTPTFSDVNEVISGPTNINGKYYIEFHRKASGSIKQLNQSGGGASTLEELNGITTTTAKVNLLDTLIAGFKPGTPSISTALNGSDITITITPGTADSRFATTLYNIYRSTDGVSYSLYDTEATTEYTDSSLDSGTYYYYVTTQNALTASDASNIDSEAVVNTEIFYDDFTGGLSGTVVNPNSNNILISGESNQLKVTAVTATSSTSENNYYQSPTSATTICMLGFDFVQSDNAGKLNAQLEIFVDSLNKIQCYELATGNAAFIVRYGSSQTLGFYDSGITMVGNRFAISIEADHTIKYWHHTGGVYVELDSGTSKVQDIGAVKQGRINCFNTGSPTPGDVILIDNFKFDNAIVSS